MTKSKEKDKKKDESEIDKSLDQEEIVPEDLQPSLDNEPLDESEDDSAKIPPPKVPSPPTDVYISINDYEALKISLDEKTKLVDEYLSRLKYLQADFDNYKKWSEKDKAEFTRIANEKLVRAVLPIIDSLEKALESSKQERTPLRDGVELIYESLLNELKSVGLIPMNTLGTKFDPFKHEAMIVAIRNDITDGTILEELQRGYLLNDRVIRTAKVKIAKKPEKDAEQEVHTEQSAPKSPTSETSNKQDKK